MSIETKIEQAKNLKSKLDNMKQIKAELKQISDDIITHKKAEFNAKIIEKIGNVKNDQNKIDRLIQISQEFAKKDFKDYEKCIEEFEKNLEDLDKPAQTQTAYSFGSNNG